jgi:hypothetical protein
MICSKLEFRMYLVQILGRTFNYLMFVVFCNPDRQMLRYYLPLDQNCFLIHPFPIYLSITVPFDVIEFELFTSSLNEPHIKTNTSMPNT